LHPQLILHFIQTTISIVSKHREDMYGQSSSKKRIEPICRVKPKCRCSRIWSSDKW